MIIRIQKIYSLQNDEAQMKIILPDSNTDLQSLLNNKQALGDSLLKKAESKSRIELTLPKFKIESEINLKEPLNRVCNKYLQ